MGDRQPPAGETLGQTRLGSGIREVEIQDRTCFSCGGALTQAHEGDDITPIAHPKRCSREALGAFLHDRDLLGQEWAREGVEQLKRSELVER